MNNRVLKQAILITLLSLLAACGKEQSVAVPKTPGVDAEVTHTLDRTTCTQTINSKLTVLIQDVAEDGTVSLSCTMDGKPNSIAPTGGHCYSFALAPDTYSTDMTLVDVSYWDAAGPAPHYLNQVRAAGECVTVTITF